MNKKELIDYCNVLKENKNRFINCIDVDRIIKRIEQLDEPETGHADEAPRYVKNILARLRELPLHDREVWLKTIMGEFEKDFSHAKWREGYEQGKLDGSWVGNQLKDADKIRRELNQVKIPQFIADYIEYAKNEDYHLLGAMNEARSHKNKNIEDWLHTDDNMELFARAWLDGYEVEEEKRYRVKVKTTGQYLRKDENSIRFSSFFISDFTRNDIEDLGFGWVFDCPGIEIEEVE